MSMGEIAAGLRAVVDAASEGRRHLMYLADSMAGTGSRIRTVLEGNTSADVNRGLGDHSRAREGLLEADHSLAGMIDVVIDYARTIEISIRPTPTGKTEAASHATSWIRQAAQELPERATDNSPTRGVAFDESGKPLTSQAITSGRNIASTDELKPLPGLAGWPWTLTDHVESAVAAKMRESGAPKQVTLVLNNPPCEQGRFACRRILPHILPKGAALTIYVTDPSGPDGVRFYGTYSGTGKALRTADQ